MSEKRLIKIMIIDDEPRTGRRLSRIIGESKLSVQVTGMFVNSMEGLEQARLNRPDIIITDVCMPQINGIEFATAIKRFHPDCQIIFISAYSDKEYLKAAISLRAVRYVEKPFNNEEILEALELTVASVNEHYDRLHILAQNQKLMGEQERDFRNRAALEFLTPGQEESVLEKLNTFYPEFTRGVGYYTLICRVNHEDALVAHMFSVEGLEAYFSVCLSARKDSNILVVHVCTRHVKQREEIERFYMDLQNELAGKADFFLAVGRPVNGMENIYCSYMDAVVCLKKLFFMGYNRVAFFEAADENMGESFEYEESLFFKFQEALEKDRFQEATDIIRHQYYKMRDPLSRYEVNSIRNAYYRLLSVLNLVCNSRGTDSVFGGDDDFIWKKISEKDTIFELQEYFDEKLKAFIQIFIEKNKDSHIVFQIKEYVEKHYQEYDLSINRMAEELHFTPAYLCRIFKKEMGCTINAYVVDFRILKAKKLLKQQNIKLYEVSEKVGYADQNYFSRQFKKLEGMTPSEFKEKYFI